MAERSEISQKLTSLRERAGYSVRDFAKKIGREASSYQWYENGYKKPFLPNDLIEEIAPVLIERGIDRAEIIALAGKHFVKSLTNITLTPEQAPIDNGSLETGVTEVGGVLFYSLPRYDAALSAGPGSIIDPNAEPIGYHLVEMSWIKALTNTTPENLAVLRVANDSMRETLQDGDWVLIDRSQKRLTRTGIYGLEVGEDTWVKRIEIDLADKRLRVISDNPRYPMQTVTEDQLRVIGRVLAVVMRKV